MQKVKLLVLIIAFAAGGVSGDELSQLKMIKLIKNVNASSCLDGNPAENAVDGNMSTSWVSSPSVSSTFEIDFGKEVDVIGTHIYFDHGDTDAIEDFNFSYEEASGTWQDISIYKLQSARVDLGCGKIKGNARSAMWFKFQALKMKKLRITLTKTQVDSTKIREVTVWSHIAGLPSKGFCGLGTGIEGGWDGLITHDDIPLIYLNQSGFNLNRPKRFTAPTIKDGTKFIVRHKDGKDAFFTGTIQNNLGDFTPLNPLDDKEYVVVAAGETSVPFRIGPWWIERVTYQNAIDFMIDSRNHLGTSRRRVGNSIGWRDDCHFAFEVNTLVAQYLSNPKAYERMPGQIKYEKPSEPAYWGGLTPYPEDAPDIVKMIHWGTDVIITGNFRHEMLKEQLACFVYAWPWLERWLDKQNYDVVSEYAFAHWGDSKIEERYAYDKTPEHDLFAVKKVLGSTKGEMPPGHSVQPNLMMYEVAKRQGRADAKKYFDAAFAQVEWMIANLDWNDPQTTKGQRMSEHVTMTGLAHFMTQYPKRAPKGLKQKITDWAKVVIRRSENMWDFRKLTDDGDWTPSGDQPTMWNEPGNIIGFPACLTAAMQVIDDPKINQRLKQLAYSHMDNAFGRNPTGRHFSFNAPREIEGVEVGWYSEYGTGVGTLQNTRFIFEAAPKKQHYPYNPKVGNIGWSEGWVNFNTAFNASLAYMAHHETDIKLRQKSNTVIINLRAPLNFDYSKEEPVEVWVISDNGDREKVVLKETAPYMEDFTGVITIAIGEKKASDGILQLGKDGYIEASYGLGYMKKVDRIDLQGFVMPRAKQLAETVTERLVTPEMTDGKPAAGKRVRQAPPEYEGTNVFHSLYLPPNWTSGKKYPVIVEYTGNKWSGSKSTGKIADANLGYGLTGGKDFIWVVLPCVETGRKENAVVWWGDLQATIDYCKVNVPRICREFGGDPDNVFLCGFSRGAIAVNYLGLHDDEIAKLWKGFISHDHYDGVFPVSDLPSAIERLKRINGRPQLICSTMGTLKTRIFLAPYMSYGDFTFLDVEVNRLFKLPDGKIVHPHTDLWMCIDSPYRQEARRWLHEVLQKSKKVESANLDEAAAIPETLIGGNTYYWRVGTTHAWSTVVEGRLVSFRH